MNSRIYLVGVCFSLLLLSCKKETMSDDYLSGTWKYSSYTFVHSEEESDSSNYSKEIQEGGYLTIDPGTETDFVYGTGMAKLPFQIVMDSLSPLYKDGEPVMMEEAILIENGNGPNVKLRFNQKGYAREIVKYGAQYQLNTKFEFSLLSKNKMNIKILHKSATQGINTDYTYALIELTK